MLYIDDIIEEFEELESAHCSLEEAVANAEEEGTAEEVEEAEKNLKEFEEGEEGQRMEELHDLLEELKGYGGEHQWGGDWFPAHLIEEGQEFTDYCEELTKDCGYLPSDIPHWLCIDWEATAENLKVDYSSVEFEGTSYLFRV